MTNSHVPAASAARFRLGRLVATPGALAALRHAESHPIALLVRHMRGDWGEVDDENRAQNEMSLITGMRLRSSYTLGTGTKVWVITEADRSVTTILLPNEY